VEKQTTKQAQKRPFSDLFDCDGCIMYQDRTDDQLIPRMVIPRVVKNDMRKFFPTMLANVYNSNDCDFIGCFMGTYYRPDFTLIQQLFGRCLFNLVEAFK
jgi:hypothetical protein